MIPVMGEIWRLKTTTTEHGLCKIVPGTCGDAVYYEYLTGDTGLYRVELVRFLQNYEPEFTGDFELEFSV